MKEDLKMAKKELKELQEQSFALELLKDYKKANKRLFIIILVILGMWISTIIAFLIYINTVGYEETEEIIDIKDVEVIDNSHIKIGDDIWEVSN